jgi:hypothetical protein
MRLVSLCPVYKIKRVYKSKIGFERGKQKPCVSCSNSLKAGGTGNVRVKNDKKNCHLCKTNKSVSQFHRYASGKYHSLCQPCKLNTFKEDYDRMYKIQKGKCYICNKKESVLDIDHNHDTNAIRKLLCRHCNTALGLVKENITPLQHMIMYLEKENERTI